MSSNPDLLKQFESDSGLNRIKCRGASRVTHRDPNRRAGQLSTFGVSNNTDPPLRSISRAAARARIGSVKCSIRCIMLTASNPLKSPRSGGQTSTETSGSPKTFLAKATCSSAISIPRTCHPRDRMCARKKPLPQPTSRIVPGWHMDSINIARLRFAAVLMCKGSETALGSGYDP